MSAHTEEPQHRRGTSHDAQKMHTVYLGDLARLRVTDQFRKAAPQLVATLNKVGTELIYGSTGVI
jgi:hypothetical protein